MKITKLGHCCLLIETKGLRILTDPGSFTIEAHSKLKKIDYILYTHEHGDHYHLESLRVLVDKNPDVLIYANTSVSELLTREGLYHHVIKNGDTVLLKDGLVSVTGAGTSHAMMHKSIPVSDNTGYMIDERLFYPGDAFVDPKTAVEILALPVSGPWMKLAEAIDYALAIKPKTSFPVHDGIAFGSSTQLPAQILPENGIEFLPLKAGESHMF